VAGSSPRPHYPPKMDEKMNTEKPIVQIRFSIGYADGSKQWEETTKLVRGTDYAAQINQLVKDFDIEELRRKKEFPKYIMDKPRKLIKVLGEFRQKYEYVKIGKYKVKKNLMDEYIAHLNQIDKGDLQYYEEDRQRLHNAIFENLKLKRHTIEGQEFSENLDKYCTIFVRDPLTLATKLINSAKTQEERDRYIANYKFVQEMIRKVTNK
jgi:hypothetical protein